MITGDTTAAGPGPAGTDPLEVFHAAGVLSEADVRLARRLGRIGGDGDPEVLLAVALALRGPRYGHVCVELSRISDTVAVEPGPASAGARPPELPVDATTLPWPDPGIWAAQLAASPLVRLE